GGVVMCPPLAPRARRRWQLAQAASAPRTVAPPWRSACTGSAESSCPRRYRLSPGGGPEDAALSAQFMSSDRASATAGAAPRASFGIGCRPWRGILGGSEQVAVIVHQLIGRDESLDP